MIYPQCNERPPDGAGNAGSIDRVYGEGGSILMVGLAELSPSFVFRIGGWVKISLNIGVAGLLLRFE